jgi:hypothetical protein
MINAKIGAQAVPTAITSTKMSIGTTYIVALPSLGSVSLSRYRYPLIALRTKKMKRKKAEPEELLVAIAEAVDDGFCPSSTLISHFPRLGHRELVRLRERAVRRGLILERRGPDGQIYVALTSEGWRALRSSRTF